MVGPDLPGLDVARTLLQRMTMTGASLPEATVLAAMRLMDTVIAVLDVITTTTVDHAATVPLHDDQKGGTTPLVDDTMIPTGEIMRRPRTPIPTVGPMSGPQETILHQGMLHILVKVIRLASMSVEGATGKFISSSLPIFILITSTTFLFHLRVPHG